MLYSGHSWHFRVLWPVTHYLVTNSSFTRGYVYFRLLRGGPAFAGEPVTTGCPDLHVDTAVHNERHSNR